MFFFFFKGGNGRGNWIVLNRTLLTQLFSLLLPVLKGKHLVCAMDFQVDKASSNDQNP